MARCTRKLPQFGRPLGFLLWRQLLGVELVVGPQILRFAAAGCTRRKTGLHSQQRIAHLRHFVDNQLEPPPETDLADLKLGQQILRRDDIERDSGRPWPRAARPPGRICPRL